MTSDRPYTDDDLRAEAARQHATLTEDPEFMCVGEQMDGTPIPSTVVDLEPETGEPLEMSRAWSHLGEHDFDEAQRKIHRLINGAADVSEWAVNLGADGLEAEEHSITVNGNNQPIARIHFAFEAGMPDEMRTALVEGIGEAIADAL